MKRLLLLLASPDVSSRVYFASTQRLKSCPHALSLSCEKNRHVVIWVPLIDWLSLFSGQVPRSDHRDGGSGGWTCVRTRCTARIRRYDRWCGQLHHITPLTSRQGFSQFSNEIFVSLTASQAAAQARGQSSQQSAAASSITGMSLQEAQQILNMSTLSPEEIQKVRKRLEPMARALWPCCFRSFFTCAETYFPFWDNKSMECPSTFLANMFTVFENLICLVAKYSGLKDLFVFVSFRTTITFSKSMTSRWAVHFTFNQKWVTATAKIFSF